MYTVFKKTYYFNTFSRRNISVYFCAIKSKVATSTLIVIRTRKMDVDHSAGVGSSITVFLFYLTVFDFWRAHTRGDRVDIEIKTEGREEINDLSKYVILLIVINFYIY